MYDVYPYILYVFVYPSEQSSEN